MPFLILVIIICMIVALFAVQNAVAVSLNFVFWSFSASLVLVILGAFLMGVLVATCFLLTMKAKHYLKDKKMREEMQQLQAENKRLQERVAMLQHTQLLHNEAAQAEASRQVELAAAEKTAAESGSRQ
ncbi:LapA family protein [Phascolarctobacterium succinatutens]|uniref:LapA family protein n=1 Tax=Phascolarctobacterium succinatutens TaxID=626940 RepID=UPI003A952358